LYKRSGGDGPLGHRGNDGVHVSGFPVSRQLNLGGLCHGLSDYLNIKFTLEWI
jgi:hypothetical protein